MKEATTICRRKSTGGIYIHKKCLCLSDCFAIYMAIRCLYADVHVEDSYLKPHVFLELALPTFIISNTNIQTVQHETACHPLGHAVIM